MMPATTEITVVFDHRDRRDLRDRPYAA